MKVTVWSKYNCPNCDQAKVLLSMNNIQFKENKIGDGYTKEELLEAIPSARSVPQVIINDAVIGGLTELKKYLEEQNVNQ